MRIIDVVSERLLDFQSKWPRADFDHDDDPDEDDEDEDDDNDNEEYCC